MPTGIERPGYRCSKGERATEDMNQDTSNTIPLRRFLMWLTLFFIALLAVLSIVGAFLGAERAGILFNSLPLIVYWIALVILLAAGVLVFVRLRRKPGSLLIHMGCMVILIGAMVSSEKGHTLQKELLGSDKLYKGYLYLSEFPEEIQSNRVFNETMDEEVGRLAFELRLEDYWMDYYWPEGRLLIQKYPVQPLPDPDDPNRTVLKLLSNEPEQNWLIPDRIGEELELPAPLKKVKIVRVIRNLQVRDRITDRPRDTMNPALVVEIEWADGFRDQRFVFPRNMPHHAQTDGFVFIYMFVKPQRWEVKDYYSDVTVIDFKNRKQHQQIIEVNHPLHYGGYHFYQNKGDEPEVLVTEGEQRRIKPVGFTILEVVSDTGLKVVYLGFWLLSVGVFWQCWFRHIPGYGKKQNRNGY